MTLLGDSTERAGAAWFRVLPYLTSGKARRQAALRQQGYVAVTGRYFIYPALQVAPDGAAAMVGTFPAAIVTQRRVHDAGAGASRIRPAAGRRDRHHELRPDGTRWGDYSWAVIDPERDVDLAGDGVCPADIEPDRRRPRELGHAGDGRVRAVAKRARRRGRAAVVTCKDSGVDLAAAYEPVVAEIGALLPAGAVVVDAHTHLGRDEDGQSLDPAGLIELPRSGRACHARLHVSAPRSRASAWLPDPQRPRSAMGARSGGRLYPYCRLDPAEDPVGEAERCLALGARGIKLHPRAQAFGFGDRAAESIWKVADEAEVPILIHAGRGMPRMDPLADLALRYPDVVLVLAHAAIADQGMFASRLADHPNIVYDTSTFSVFDQIELFARVPAERIVFASDVPYGRPLGALHTALRIAAYAGLDERERIALVGATMTDILERRPLPDPKPPRVPEIRPVSGRLTRINGYVMMSFAAAISSGPPPEFTRSLPFVAMARAACRDPDPGPAGPALERIDRLLSTAEQVADRRQRGGPHGGRTCDGSRGDRGHRAVHRDPLTQQASTQARDRDRVGFYWHRSAVSIR